jgi:glycosyltransferase involved in cell wall biosynthesis
MYLVAKECDAFICTTPFLKQKLEIDFKKPTYVLQNSFNKEQFEISKEIIARRTYDSDSFCLGYFSGSNSHLNDFEVCKSALLSFLRKYPFAKLKIVGYMNLGNEFDELQNENRVIRSPFCSYENLQYEIGQVDVNIIPLVNNEFNSGKSELKYYEAALVKVPSIISNVGIYKDVINEKNGILVDDESWIYALEDILNFKKRNEISDNAYISVLEKYGFHEMEKRIQNVYDIILGE